MSETRLGDQAADAAKKIVGSWGFVLFFNICFFAWIIFQDHRGHFASDPYPYTLLNLILSYIAGITGPLILIATNRQEQVSNEVIDRIDSVISHVAETLKQVHHISLGLQVLLEEQREHLVAASAIDEEIAEDLEQIAELLSEKK